MTPDNTDLSAPIPCRRVTTSPTVRLKTLNRRMKKTAEFCRSFDACVAYELLHEDRKCIRPEVVKQLKS